MLNYSIPTCNLVTPQTRFRGVRACTRERTQSGREIRARGWAGSVLAKMRDHVLADEFAGKRAKIASVTRAYTYMGAWPGIVYVE